MNIIIAGISEVTNSLLKRLDDNEDDITVIGNSIGKLDNENINISFVEADFCDVSAYDFIPEDKDLSDYFFLATSDDDAKNVVASMIAKEKKIKNIHVKIDNLFYKNTISKIVGTEIGNFSEEFSSFTSNSVVFAKEAVDEKLDGLIRRIETTRSFIVDNSDIEMVEIELLNKYLDGFLIKDLPKFIFGVDYRICFIERDGNPHVPNGNFELKLNDRIYILVKSDESFKVTNKLGYYSTLKNEFGDSLSDEEIEELKEKKRSLLFLGNPKNFMDVATKVKENFDITICIEKIDDIIEYGEATKDFTIVEYKNSPTTIAVKEIDKNDVFVAATDSDEINFITSQIAKQSGVKTVIPFVFSKDYFSLYVKLKIYRKISYSEALVNEFTNRINGSVMFRVDTMQNDIMLNKFTVEEKSKLDGHQIMEHQFPNDMIFGIVQKGENIVIPTGLTELNKGDIVTMILLKENQERVEKYFKEKKFLGVFR